MVIIVLMLGVGGRVIDRYRGTPASELRQEDQLFDPACVVLPGRESATELPGNVFCDLRKKYATKERDTPEDLLEKFIEGTAAQFPADTFVIDLGERVDRLEGRHLAVLEPVVKVGDLVRWIPRTTDNLVGLVVGIEEDIGRAKVFWQKYNVHKLVELKHLEILRK